MRHSAPERIRIALRKENREIVLQVCDNGQGCKLVRAGNGLTGISERARQFGGSARYESTQGGGFTVEVRLPPAGNEAAA
jgi:signal transduction histidine kinase